MDGIKTFLKKISSFLIENTTGDGILTPKICEKTISLLAQVPEFKKTNIRFSIDLFSPDLSKWWIQASTDPSAPIERDFPTEKGLSGWLIKKDRHRLEADRHSDLPADVAFIAGYERTESVFVLRLQFDSQPVGCLCAISDQPHSIGPEFKAMFRRLVNLLSVFVGPEVRTLAVGGRKYFHALEHPPRISVVPDWVTKNLPGSYEWANFWRWNEKNGYLEPVQVSRGLSNLGTGWLKPLLLGEGFVGTCAQKLETIVESRIENQRGEDSDIFTPLDEIRPNIKLRSIMAVPVRDSERFYGVLAVLADSYGHFQQEDVHHLEPFAAELASLLRRELEADFTEWKRELRERLGECLKEAIKPKEFWPRLGTILKRMVDSGWCSRAMVLVRKRDIPYQYTCKSLAPETLLEKMTFDAINDSFLHSLLRSEVGTKLFEKLPEAPAKKILMPQGTKRIWVGPFTLHERVKATPTLLGIVCGPSRSIYSQPFGMRSLGDDFHQMFSFIFEITRAVITSADYLSMTKAQARLMAAETHDLKQPLGTIKHVAEALADDLKSVQDHLAELSANPSCSDGSHDQDTFPFKVGLSMAVLDDAKPKTQRIVNYADELVVKVENILYRSWLADPTRRVSGEEEIVDAQHPVDLLALINKIIAEVKVRVPISIVVERPNKNSPDRKLMAYGSDRWFGVAIRNVLDNSVKFGRGAPVTVRWRIKRERMVEDTFFSENSVLLEIEDHGIGIPAHEHKKIFQAGYHSAHTRRHNVTGSQIALSVSKDILESAKGKIWVSSETYQGSVFYIQLPLLQERRL